MTVRQKAYRAPLHVRPPEASSPPSAINIATTFRGLKRAPVFARVLAGRLAFSGSLALASWVVGGRAADHPVMAEVLLIFAVAGGVVLISLLAWSRRSS